MKIVLGVGLVAGLLLLGAGWILSGAPMPAIPPARIAAPAGFDEAAYGELDAAGSTEQAQVLNIGAYGQHVEHYFLPDLGVTFFMLFTQDDQSRIVFVNSDGELIGEITEQPGIFPMGRYMVTPQAYYEVTADGVSGRQMMVAGGVVSQDQLTRMIGESTLYRHFGASDLPKDDPDAMAGRKIHVMQHNGQWKRVATEAADYHEWKVADFVDLDAVYRISRAPEAGPAPNLFGGNFRVELTHFDQQEYLPRRGAPMGSTTGMGRAAQWTGTGYYTVFIDDEAALRFRIENDQEYLSDMGPAQLIVEGNPALGFIVITHTDQNNWNDVLVVSGR